MVERPASSRGGSVPSVIEIVEVAPRDGLQNEQTSVSVADKVELINRARLAGLKRIEVGSFVNPERVPQMANTEEVIAQLPADDAVYIGLVVNRKGAERALRTRVHEIGVVCLATDTFAQRNQRQTAQESIQLAGDIVREAIRAGRRGHITIGTAFGCPFEGEVPAQRVIDMAKRAAEVGAVEVALADTIGVAVPSQVTDLIGATVEAIRPIPVRAHFHNTRNAGVANAWAAINAGASTLDASIGGVGGCPFAPAAAGNVATEDVVYLLERSRVESGVRLQAVIETANWLAAVLKRPLPGAVSRAGGFPRDVVVRTKV